MKMCHVIILNRTSLNLSAGSVLSEQQVQTILPQKKAQHVNLGHTVALLIQIRSGGKGKYLLVVVLLLQILSFSKVFFLEIRPHAIHWLLWSMGY